MKALLIFWGLLSIGTIAWASPLPDENYSSREYFSEDTLPISAYLRLSSIRCEDCTLVVRDLIEVGAVNNTVEAVKNVLSGEFNYNFRLALLSSCNHCYRAAHFWEMNILNRPAQTDEIHRWLKSDESKPLIEYFSES